MRRLALSVLVALLLGCGGDGKARAEVASLRVLFVGNSLTATNDLPGLRESVARTAKASAAVALGRGVPRARRCGR